jgi:hypothetical protein
MNPPKMKKTSALLLVALCMLAFNFTTKAQISGNVFRDYNGNGTKQTAAPSLEPNAPSIIVNVYNASDIIIASYITTATVTNNYTIPATGTAYNGIAGSNTGFVPANTKVRVEYILPTPSNCGIQAINAYASSAGISGSSTSIQFITAGATATNINYAINDPQDYVSTTNPEILVSVARQGDPLPATGANLVGNATNHTVKFNYNDNVNYAVTDHSNARLMGSVWGQAYSPYAKKSFFGSLVRRQFGLGSLGSGGIYLVNAQTANSVTAFYDLDAAGYPTRASSGAL